MRFPTTAGGAVRGLPAFDRPIKFYGTAYVRNGTSKTELARYPEKERALWNRRLD